MGNIKPPSFLGVHSVVGCVFCFGVSAGLRMGSCPLVLIKSDLMATRGLPLNSWRMEVGGSHFILLTSPAGLWGLCPSLLFPTKAIRWWKFISAPKCLWWSEAVQQLTKICPYSGIFSSFSGAESSGMSGTGNSEQHISHHAMVSKARLRTYVLLSVKS